MPRKLRICMPDLTYHITSRCIEKRPLMQSDKMKELMHDVINLAADKYNFKLVAYTLMDNHFHFYIKTVKKGETISRIMQFIKSQYARRYNRMMNRIGPFWNERFHDTIVEKSSNPIDVFLYILVYIGFNPVRSKYVKDPRDYPFSSYRSYVDEDYVPPVKITLHDYFLNLGSTFKERANKLLEYEDRYRKRLIQENIFL
ncbi:MAG: transposase [Spirochaetes bacterium]|nr:transposase [Spirochaetota bacterium]